MAVRISALGTLRVEQDGHVLDRLPAQRIRCALLLYMAIERETTRDRLMGLFWSERPPDRARHLLSQTLYELRQDLGNGWLDAVGEQLIATDRLEIDVCEFVEAVEAGEHDAAVAMYGGAFLGGASLGATRELEGWLDRQQAKLVRLHRQARRASIDGRVERGALPEALAQARSWVELDPLDDEAQHRLIELMAATGDRSGALSQYERYARMVERELELEPLDETRELVERIREGEVGERPAPAATLEDGEAARLYSAMAEHRPEAVEPAYSNETDDTDAAGRIVGMLRWLQQHRAVQWMVAYSAGAVVLLETASIISDAFGMPIGVVRGLALALGAGALAVGLFGWRQTERRRRTGLPEALIGALAVLLAVYVFNELKSPTPGEAVQPGLDPRRIAVLPFNDFSSNGDLGPEAAGFTEALINELGQVEGLYILSRTAVEPFREHKPPLDSIIATLRAGMLVEGSLTRLGDSIRVTFQLINGETATQLTSRTISRPADQIFSLVQDLPRQVALALREALGTEIRLRETRHAAGSGESWRLVQRAGIIVEDEQLVQMEDVKAALGLLERADSLLRRAEAVDPNWPEPIVRRARVAAMRAKQLAPRPGSYEAGATRQAIAHAERALALDSLYTPALEMRGTMRFRLAESLDEAEAELGPLLYREAESDLRTVVELDPRNARGWWSLSLLLRRKGSFAEAKVAARRALDADAFLDVPVESLLTLFQTALDQEELAEATDWCGRIHELHPESMRWVQCEYQLMASDALPANVSRAWNLVDSMVARGSEEQSPAYRGWARICVAKVLVRAGEPDSARAVLQAAVPDPPPIWASYDAAHAYLMLGDYDRALEMLEYRVRQSPTRAGSLASDWWFRPLHGDPRLDRLIQIATENDRALR